MKPAGLILLLFLLIPSAAYLWQYSDVPRFGGLHDDSIYYVSAKSLADGGGYRIESLPGEPAQTKYPPLYPLLLSIAWRLDPRFPHNLPMAAWISWLALPAVAVQLAVLYPRLGISIGRTWLLLFLFAANPYVILFSTQLLSELLFLALALAGMFLVERAAKGTPAAAIAAGAVGGLAYLARSAGIALLAAAVVYLWIRKERRSAFLFAAAMLPFIVGWTIWARLHQTATNDPALIYYLDYLRYEMYSVSIGDLHLFLWKNLDGLLWGLGGLILPQVADSSFLKALSDVLAVAMISGVVRIIRRGHGLLYALFAAANAALLLAWHFPPNERFVLPLFPLALAGLLVEMEHLLGLLRAGLRHKERGERVLAAALLTVVIGIFAGCLGLQLYLGAVFLPEDTRQHRLRRIDHVAAYGWIRAHTPLNASFLSADDAVLYLYTGRHAIRKQLPPALWYRADRAGMIHWLTDLKPYAREHGLAYLDFAGVHIPQGIADEDRVAIEAAIRSSRDLSPLYRGDNVTVYGFTAH